MARKRYEIEIHPPYAIWAEKGFLYGVNLNKTFGDYHSLGTHAKDKEDALKQIRDMIKGWKEYDSILQRIPDKPSEKNIEFKSFTKSITLQEILHGTRLTFE